jgi:hypothetical protein
MTRETRMAPTSIAGSAVAITRKRRCVRSEKVRTELGMNGNLTTGQVASDPALLCRRRHTCTGLKTQQLVII